MKRKTLFSMRGLQKIVQEISPGVITKEGLIYLDAQLSEYLHELIPLAREMAFHGSRKKITSRDLNLARKQIKF